MMMIMLPDRMGGDGWVGDRNPRHEMLVFYTNLRGTSMMIILYHTIPHAEP